MPIIIMKNKWFIQNKNLIKNYKQKFMKKKKSHTNCKKNNIVCKKNENLDLIPSQRNKYENIKQK